MEATRNKFPSEHSHHRLASLKISLVDLLVH
jgi:hypothetical protein